MNTTHYGRVHLLLMLAYLAFVIYGSLVPLGYVHVPLEEAIQRFRHIRYFHLAVQSRADLVANFLLFIPLTFLAMGGSTREGRGRGAAPLAAAIAVSAIALGVAIEFLQIYFPQRTVSLNDILAESFGGLAGVVVWFIFGRRISDWARQLWRQKARDRLAASILSGYVVFVVLYQLLPFDLTIRPVELYHKLKGSRLILVPFSGAAAGDPYYFVSAVGLMIPVGYLLALLRAGRQRGGWAVVTLQTGAFAAMIEVGQLFVYSRYSNTTDVILGAVGGLLGAMAADFFGPVARRRPLDSALWARHGRTIRLLLLAGWTCGLAAMTWYPFQFAWPADGLARAAWEFVGVPLQKQHGMAEARATAQVVRQIVVFLALGMLLRSFWPRSSGAGRLAAGAIGLAVSMGLEFSQVFTPPRTADLAGGCFGAVGSILGVAWVWRFTDVFLKAAPTRARSADDHARPEARPSARAQEPTPIPSPRPAGSPSAGRRVLGLDGLRAGAALAVFGVHFQQITGVGGQVGPFDLRRLLANGHAGVCLFFVLSGFLLSLPFWLAPRAGSPAIPGGAKWVLPYALGRIGRIGPAYFLCLSVLAVTGSAWSSRQGLASVVLHYAFLHNFAEFSLYGISPPFWSMAVQAQFYVLLPVLMLVVRPLMPRRLAAETLLAVLAVAAVAAQWAILQWADARAADWPWPRQIVRPDGLVLTHSLLAHLPHFLLGMLAASAFVGMGWLQGGGRPPGGRAPRAWAWDLLFWGSAAATVLILGIPWLADRLELARGRYNLPYVPLLVAAMIVSAPQAPVARRVLELAPLRLLGVVSFGLYVYHLPCLKLAAKVLRRAGLDPSQSWALFGLAGLAMSILVAAGSYLLLERPIVCRARRGRVYPTCSSQYLA